MFVNIYGRRISTIDSEFVYSFVTTKLRTWTLVLKHPNFLDSLKDLRYRYATDRYENRNGEPFCTPFKTEKTNYVNREVINRSKTAFKKGLLYFDEAYTLSNKYLHNNPRLCGAFSIRFSYVFIDEAQDTDSEQYNIIQNLFSSSKIQMIGDPNQTIYDDAGTLDEGASDESWTKAVSLKPHIRIPNSKRLSYPIALAIKHIAEFPETSLQGSLNISIKPKLLFYHHSKVLRVIPVFEELIRTHGLNINNRHPNKVIGRIVKKNSDASKITIPSYYPPFYRTSKRKVVFDGLRYYLVKPDDISGSCNSKHISDLIVSSIIRMFQIAEIYDLTKGNKHFTKTSLSDYLLINHQELYTILVTKIASWSYRIFNHACNTNCSDRELPYPTCVLEDIAVFTEQVLFPMFGAEFNKIRSFINNEIEEMQNGSDLQNTYTNCIDGNSVHIEISSVHAVKGETHTSTLFLDTFYRAYDSKRLVNFFTSGGTTKDCRNPSTLKALRVSYVAMSRPTHLLCVAFPLPEGQPILEYWLSKPEHVRFWDIVEIP
jgi:hypothetical protein